MRENKVGPNETANHNDCVKSFNHSRPFTSVKRNSIISEPERLWNHQVDVHLALI